MNEQIKELAEQAGVSFHHALGATYTYGKLSEILERFAELVRQDEREACANLSDEHDDDVGMSISRAIRARGEA